jgi:hypothetical protein
LIAAVLGAAAIIYKKRFSALKPKMLSGGGRHQKDVALDPHRFAPSCLDDTRVESDPDLGREAN